VQVETVSFTMYDKLSRFCAMWRVSNVFIIIPYDFYGPIFAQIFQKVSLENLRAKISRQANICGRHWARRRPFFFRLMFGWRIPPPPPPTRTQGSSSVWFWRSGEVIPLCVNLRLPFR
jgi:hypothetical protein